VTRRLKIFTKESEDFQEKILHRSGLGFKTYFPAGISILLLYFILRNFRAIFSIVIAMHDFPPVCNMDAARIEADYVMGTCLEELCAKTGITFKDIDILIVNCSLFNPTPSLAAMVQHNASANPHIDCLSPYRLAHQQVQDA